MGKYLINLTLLLKIQVVKKKLKYITYAVLAILNFHIVHVP